MNTPPQDIPAEEALLGSVLLDNTVLDDLELLPEDFYMDVNHQIFKTMLTLHAEGEPIDVLIVAKFASDIVHLSNLMDHVPTSANFQVYGKRIKDKAIMRKIMIVCSHMVAAAQTDDNPRNVLDDFEEAVMSIGANERSSDFVSFDTNMIEHLTKLEQVVRQTEKPGIMTGFNGLDKNLNGLHGGDLIVLAARPAMGKTTLGFNILTNVAEQGIPAGAMSFEMSEESLRVRLICSRAKIDSSKVRGGDLTNTELEAYIHTAGTMSKLPIYINDDPRTNLLRLKSSARRLVRKSGIKLLVVDYLQLMTAGEKMEGRVNEVSHISRQMKLLAKALNIPIILISQLNRSNEKEKQRPPRLSDLRDSGAIEQDADIVVFLYSKNNENKNNETEQLSTDMIIAKNRAGATGTKQLDFEKIFNRFTEFRG